MKPKNLILIFLFGLFLFLLPGFADAACGMSCTFVIPGDPQTPQECSWMKGGACACERLGLVGNVGEIDTDYCTSNFKFCCGTECNYNFRKCKCNGFPSGDNGELCVAKDGKFYFPATCNYTECDRPGKWDASDPDSGDGPACIQCNGKIESKWLGNTTGIYDNPCVDPPTGDGKCESACGADTACDEITDGNQCTVGQSCQALGRNCQSEDYCSGCVCVAPPPSGCTIGGISYTNGTCNGKCQYCDISKSTTAWSNVPSGKVCYNNSLVNVSDNSGQYCNYDEDCDAGDCSANNWYTSCNGSGSCRSASDHTDSYVWTRTASNGYVLKSDCSQVKVSTSDYCGTPVGTCNDAIGCDGSMLYKGCAQGSCSSESGYGYTDTTDDSECDGRVCSSTNYCKNSCAWYTGKKCSNGSCTQGYGGGNCNPYTCSGGSCTSICEKDCGATCESDADCPVGSTCQANCTCSGVVNNPPTCNYLSASPSSGTAPLNVSFTASGSDTDGTIAQYEFDFGDGSAKVYSSTAGATHTYNAVGKYCAKLRVQDDDGAWSTNTGSCPGGTCTVEITATGVVTEINPPIVTTNAANPVGTTSATLNGYLNNLGYDPGTCPSCSCIVWFEWGTTGTAGVSGSYGNKTAPVSMTAAGPFTANISGLTAGQTYYFEAFAKNGGSW